MKCETWHTIHTHTHTHTHTITDGAELLRDLGLPAAIIGGVVLPLLGAVPDAVMIIFSGVGGSREEANTQIAVGMGWVEV